MATETIPLGDGASIYLVKKHFMVSARLHNLNSTMTFAVPSWAVPAMAVTKLASSTGCYIAIDTEGRGSFIGGSFSGIYVTVEWMT